MATEGGHDTEQFTQFRQELTRLRGLANLSQKKVGEALTEHGGEAVSGSAVGEWERGPSIPSRRNVAALERLFDVRPGNLASLLGYGDDPSIREELAELRARFDRFEEMLRSMLDRAR